MIPFASKKFANLGLKIVQSLFSKSNSLRCLTMDVFSSDMIASTSFLDVTSIETITNSRPDFVG